MTRRKTNTILWTFSGLLLSLAVLLVVLSGLSGQILVTDADGIPDAAESVMAAIHSGNWEDLEALVADANELAPETGDENSAHHLIWDAYRNSLRWSCEDGYGIGGSHVTQKVTVTCLDIPALTDAMARILPELSDNAINMTAEQALSAATEAVLRQELPLTEEKITLSFVRKNGQWLLIPDNTLLALLSGFTAG